MTNIFFVILIFIIASAITSNLPLSSITRTCLLIIPFILLSILFLFIANIENFNLTRFLPILGNGFNQTFISGITNIYSFSGILIIYFLPPLLKNNKDINKIIPISILLFTIFIILATSILLFIFSFFMAEDKILPLYEAARYIEIGTFFVRLESIFLLIWMFAFSCYLTICIKFSMHIFKKITNIKNSNILVYPLLILMFSISLIPSSYSIVKKYESIIYPKLVLYFDYIFCILILFFSYIKKKKEFKGGGSND